ncbi:MAG: hypothetical protein COX62_02340 [Deltaproteobacteria bacterium CG_4_10_14_0_2_um_filter_43_8]|nr:MAG: hypothetical protein COV43_07690 [Deltaproteobacteria bacterium CG11_big_fil_rev_8_21_14_0_20_42_23]PJA21480.1 MAG: hypothetical protein COX62_02340 [Deltaproteobacteria bacterium CG_4_10_14_0_2_um_filter_43_8]PJC63345.1 MAG: hypothetical protein CO021_10055 [Deltaproteobacteria bacterium CG_4_9_14_0_2_um_filter_42_21]
MLFYAPPLALPPILSSIKMKGCVLILRKKCKANTVKGEKSKEGFKINFLSKKREEKSHFF